MAGPTPKPKAKSARRHYITRGIPIFLSIGLFLLTVAEWVFTIRFASLVGRSPLWILCYDSSVRGEVSYPVPMRIVGPPGSDIAPFSLSGYTVGPGDYFALSICPTLCLFLVLGLFCSSVNGDNPIENMGFAFGIAFIWIFHMIGMAQLIIDWPVNGSCQSSQAQSLEQARRVRGDMWRGHELTIITTYIVLVLLIISSTRIFGCFSKKATDTDRATELQNLESRVETTATQPPPYRA